MSNLSFGGAGTEKVAQAILKAKQTFGPLLKQKDNPFFKTKYADLNALLDVCEDALAREGVLIVQSPGGDGTLMSVTTTLIHAETGGYIESTVVLPLSKQSAQDAGSAITYARRYGLQAMLCLAAEDDDGNKASGRERRQPDRRPPAKPVTGENRFQPAPIKGPDPAAERDPLDQEIATIIALTKKAANTTELDALTPRCQALPESAKKEVRPWVKEAKARLAGNPHGTDDVPKDFGSQPGGEG